MNKVLKEFKLSTWSINNKMTVLVLIVMIFLAGIFSYQSMPREAFPEIVVPQIFVSTPYPGNSAIDIEKLITRPLEKEINGISKASAKYFDHNLFFLSECNTKKTIALMAYFEALLNIC